MADQDATKKMWAAMMERLEKKWGITVVPYSPDDEHKPMKATFHTARPRAGEPMPAAPVAPGTPDFRGAPPPQGDQAQEP